MSSRQASAQEHALLSETDQQAGVLKTLAQISRGGFLRQRVYHRSHICNQCIRFIYEKMTSRCFHDDFNSHVSDDKQHLLISPSTGADLSVSKLSKKLLEPNQMTMLTIINRASSRADRHGLHTLLVMNLHGKIKFFQCFRPIYSIEQWMQGASDKPLPDQTRKILSQYGGKKFASKASIDKFIQTLGSLFSGDKTRQEVNQAGRSILGGDLYPPDYSDAIHPSLRFIQKPIQIDSDYDPRSTLTCGERCLDVVDSLLSSLR